MRKLNATFPVPATGGLDPLGQPIANHSGRELYGRVLCGCNGKRWHQHSFEIVQGNGDKCHPTVAGWVIRFFTEPWRGSFTRGDFGPAGNGCQPPAPEANRQVAGGNMFSQALSSYIIYPGMQSNSLSLLQTGISAQAVEFTFQESNIGGESWMPGGTADVKNISLNDDGRRR